MVLAQVLEKMRAEVSRTPELREAFLKGADSNEGDFAVFWPAFHLCLLSTARIKEVALSSLSKLFAHEIITSAEPGADLEIHVGQLLNNDPILKVAENEPPFLLENYSLVDEVIIKICLSMNLNTEESVQLQAIKLLLTVITNAHAQISETTLISLIFTISAIHNMAMQNSTNDITAKAALTQIINLVLSKMERHTQENILILTSELAKQENSDIVAHNSLLRHDVYLVLKYLCGKAVYTDTLTLFSTNAVEISSNAMKSRILAMELIMSILSNVGPVVSNDPLFVTIIQKDIYAAISKNSTTSNATLFELSLSIYLLTIRHYRSYMKLEIESMTNNVFLKILEMSNSSHRQKCIILQALKKLCSDPQVFR